MSDTQREPARAVRTGGAQSAAVLNLEGRLHGRSPDIGDVSRGYRRDLVPGRAVMQVGLDLGRGGPRAGPIYCDFGVDIA
jgi:hypothetical protein